MDLYRSYYFEIIKKKKILIDVINLLCLLFCDVFTLDFYFGFVIGFHTQSKTMCIDRGTISEFQFEESKHTASLFLSRLPIEL